MSRIGKKPVAIPDKVKAIVENGTVRVEGPLGKLSYNIPSGISVNVENKNIVVSLQKGAESKDDIFGTTRARINNMVSGVVKEFEKVVEITGVGFKGEVKGNKISMQLGFSHPVIVDIPQGIKMAFDAKQTSLSIKGIDREAVGNIAAQIRRLKKTEPYKGTGIKYHDEHIIRKAGKTAAAGAGAAKK